LQDGPYLLTRAGPVQVCPAAHPRTARVAARHRLGVFGLLPPKAWRVSAIDPEHLYVLYSAETQS